ncbi:helix-hairpin-helix domain-containing protein [Weeksella virosa]|uniref:Uncharacterized protein n=1 Tax=Weeksella virosa (strain ATCC 43766 / DSM 16922 / JCM 21250 / CCUG 30538 / CDC 9751 / IAM 14551 / NBRC 16016 / NCTC 11634 / CL345/78) TaxID=865938 RepID=F0P038_WEEVC|nr:helix-hairpin-helix domain-containing protein [Weeksella virosa]ADX67385.1 hypothetical protein Weevi_0670 [Weeksella virosa DSM 16922]MDK7675666.1 helix-hairpin-helix domain-containing protein [Weeksella virosa]SUP53676.1 comEA protein [Weeksella virosa]VEH62874.1 comEA protein [Weeksella virosa]
MKSSLLPFLLLTKTQKTGLIVFCIILLIGEGIMVFGSSKENLVFEEIQQSELKQILLSAEAKATLSSSPYKNRFSKSKIDTVITAFDPNDLTQTDWHKYGFTPKQAEVIMKYKAMLGGKFESKEQIRKCYVINDEAYAMLSPYILLPEKSKSDLRLGKQQTRRNIVYSRFNPNDYSENDWMKIGFSKKQAETILKYKRIVGNEFTSLEQLSKCYVISDEKFQEMKPYIDLPEKSPVYRTSKTLNNTSVKESSAATITNEQKQTIELEKFDPNKLDKEGWMKIGFTERQANTIIKYRYSLGGRFPDAATLQKCYVISDAKFKEMEPYLEFSE